MSDSNACIFTLQGSRNTGRTYAKRVKHRDISFSDPVDISSEAESFDEDDMYGSDHDMQFVCESSDEVDEVEVSPSPERRIVSVWICSRMSGHDLTLG
jgi:hypothetical protein